MKKLKYQESIDLLVSDFSKFNEQERHAFRWVFEDINDARNFYPIYKINGVDSRNSYLGWALSFFESQDQAKKRLLHLTKDKALLFKKFGTHIAEGDIKNEDGISNTANDIGHFSHFEYENVSFNNRYSIIEKVYS